MASPDPNAPAGEPAKKPRVSAEAAAIYQKGNLLAQAGKFAESAEQYRLAVIDSPDFAEAHNNLANALRMLGEMNGAVESYGRCLAIAPEAAHVHRNLAATLLNLNRLDEACRTLERVVELLPEDDESKEMLRLVRVSMAGRAEKKIVSTVLPEVEVLYQEALDAVNAGRLADAERILVRAYELKPEHAGVLHLLGVVAYQCSDFPSAVDLISRAIARQPGVPRCYYDLGNVYLSQSQFPEAIACYNQALRIQPQFFEAINNLGNALKKSNRLAEAESCYRQAIEIKPDEAVLRRNLSVILLQQGKREEALAVCRTLLVMTPDDAKIRYMAAFLSGEGRDAAPADFLVSLFDGYADKFEEHLLRELGYQAPERLREAVVRVLAGEQPHWRVLDLGCGTGLCGRAFRGLARQIVGVDLSPKMVEKARENGAYDEVTVGEIHEALAQVQEPFDLILAADVLIYVGELQAFFEGCQRALSSRGWLAFSTELDDSDTFALRQTGRFTHGEAYIRGVAEKNGFEICACDEIVCRLEESRPVPGQAFVLRKRA